MGLGRIMVIVLKKPPCPNLFSLMAALLEMDASQERAQSTVVRMRDLCATTKLLQIL